MTAASRTTLDEQEKQLLALQEAYAGHRAAGDHARAMLAREKYKALHERWLRSMRERPLFEDQTT